MAKSKKRKAKNIKPDDHFAAGPMEFARFGRLVIGRSRATQEQFEAAQARMVAQYPITVREIDVLVASIAAQIVRLPPDRLLQRGWWEYSAMIVGLGGREAGDPEKLAAARMVDYVQSVIVSVKPEQYAADVSEEGWTKLKADVETLFRRLTLDYQMSDHPHFSMRIALDVIAARRQVDRNVERCARPLQQRRRLRQHDISRIGISHEVHVVPARAVHETKCVAGMRHYRRWTESHPRAVARHEDRNDPGIGVLCSGWRPR